MERKLLSCLLISLILVSATMITATPQLDTSKISALVEKRSCKYYVVQADLETLSVLYDTLVSLNLNMPKSSEVVSWILDCYRDYGFFAPSPFIVTIYAYNKLATTYYALKLLKSLNALNKLSEEQLNQIAKLCSKLQYLNTSSEMNGGFYEDFIITGKGEIKPHRLPSAASTLLCLLILHIIGKLDVVNVDAALDYLARCQTPDGGFYYRPGATFSANDITYFTVKSLRELGYLDKIDLTKLKEKYLSELTRARSLTDVLQSALILSEANALPEEKAEEIAGALASFQVLDESFEKYGAFIIPYGSRKYDVTLYITPFLAKEKVLDKVNVDALKEYLENLTKRVFTVGGYADATETVPSIKSTFYAVKTLSYFNLPLDKENLAEWIMTCYLNGSFLPSIKEYATASGTEVNSEATCQALEILSTIGELNIIDENKVSFKLANRAKEVLKHLKKDSPESSLFIAEAYYIVRSLEILNHLDLINAEELSLKIASLQEEDGSIEKCLPCTYFAVKTLKILGKLEKIDTVKLAEWTKSLYRPDQKGFVPEPENKYAYLWSTFYALEILKTLNTSLSDYTEILETRLQDLAGLSEVKWTSSIYYLASIIKILGEKAVFINLNTDLTKPFLENETLKISVSAKTILGEPVANALVTVEVVGVGEYSAEYSSEEKAYIAEIPLKGLKGKNSLKITVKTEYYEKTIEAEFTVIKVIQATATAEPKKVNEGESVTVKVLVKDIEGNPISGATVTVSPKTGIFYKCSEKETGVYEAKIPTKGLSGKIMLKIKVEKTGYQTTYLSKEITVTKPSFPTIYLAAAIGIIAIAILIFLLKKKQKTPHKTKS
ncbi:MAG: hypothetical protein DRJ63_08020 [Thermoprotei archaeon]|nr:MAG: hypothetical protein DRJ63_08020 [Thermoprotei archaeon]